MFVYSEYIDYTHELFNKKSKWYWEDAYLRDKEFIYKNKSILQLPYSTFNKSVSLIAIGKKQISYVLFFTYKFELKSVVIKYDKNENKLYSVLCDKLELKKILGNRLFKYSVKLFNRHNNWNLYK